MEKRGFSSHAFPAWLERLYSLKTEFRSRTNLNYLNWLNQWILGPCNRGLLIPRIYSSERATEQERFRRTAFLLVGIGAIKKFILFALSIIIDVSPSFFSAVM